MYIKKKILTESVAIAAINDSKALRIFLPEK